MKKTKKTIFTNEFEKIFALNFRREKLRVGREKNQSLENKGKYYRVRVAGVQKKNC